MTEERIKELAETIEKELRYMLRETGYNGIRVQQFIAEHIRTVAAEAREEGREEGIEEMRDAVKQKIWDILHAHKILARLLVLRTSEEAERLRKQGK